MINLGFFLRFFVNRAPNPEVRWLYGWRALTVCLWDPGAIWLNPKPSNCIAALPKVHEFNGDVYTASLLFMWMGRAGWLAGWHDRWGSSGSLSAVACRQYRVIYGRTDVLAGSPGMPRDDHNGRVPDRTVMQRGLGTVVRTVVWLGRFNNIYALIGREESRDHAHWVVRYLLSTNQGVYCWTGLILLLRSFDSGRVVLRLWIAKPNMKILCLRYQTGSATALWL